MNLAIDLLFVIGMEEISWGQRIFQMETPSVLKTHNWKGEINFHNVDAFPLHNAYTVVGFYGLCQTAHAWSGQAASADAS
jgi:hypothetical protein